MTNLSTFDKVKSSPRHNMNYYDQLANDPGNQSCSTHYTYVVRVDGKGSFEEEFDAVDETLARSTYEMEKARAYVSDTEVSAEVVLLKVFYFDGTDETESDVLERNC